ARHHAPPQALPLDPSEHAKSRAGVQRHGPATPPPQYTAHGRADHHRHEPQSHAKARQQSATTSTRPPSSISPAAHNGMSQDEPEPHAGHCHQGNAPSRTRIDADDDAPTQHDAADQDEAEGREAHGEYGQTKEQSTSERQSHHLHPLNEAPHA